MEVRSSEIANMSVNMKHIAVIVAGALLLAATPAGLAQAPEKTAHIGILVGGNLAQRGHLEQALLQGLREQGYIEGKNLVLERRYADGRYERTPEFARELAAMKLDAVVTTCTPTTRAAQQALGSTPIVMAAVADPVARTLKIRLVKIEVGRPIDAHLPSAFQTALREKAAGIFVLPDEPLFLTRRAGIVTLAAKHHLPAFYGAGEFVDDGGLMSYGENPRTAYYNAASYIKKVADGANPGGIPVGQPTKFELAINMKTARAIGLTIPQSLLLRADEVMQ